MIPAWFKDEVDGFLARDPSIAVGDVRLDLALSEVGEEYVTFAGLDPYGEVVAVAVFGVRVIEEVTDNTVGEFIIWNVADALDESRKKGGRAVYVYE